MNYRKTTTLAMLTAVIAGAAPSISSAQVLEEIVVTATKRAVGLQDVPIAISVMSGQDIATKGLTSLEDLTTYMPNVHIGEGGAGTALFIRGIGSGVNFGFEQSVGTFVDGVYFGRGRSARGKFLDLERVEVLKGPQSTLFGKNTIAGAINITTAKPTDEFEAYIDTSFRSELDGLGITAMVSGPLSDNVRGRLVAKTYSDDGYVRNLAAGGDDGPQQDNFGIRGSLAWDVSDTFKLDFKVEHGTYDVIGRQQVLSEASPTASFFYRTFGDANFQPGLNYEKYDVGVLGQKPFDDTESNLAQLTAEWDFGEATLRSITGYTEYEFTNIADTDYSPLQLLARGRTEKHEQFSQELIWSSATGGNFDYLAGAFYSTEDLSNNRNTFVLFSGIPPVEAGIFRLLGGGLPSGALDGNGINFFQQKSDSLSVFAEGTLHLSDTFRTTAGLRYSNDEKSADKRGFVENIGGVLPNRTLEFLYGGPLNLASRHEYSLSRDEDHVTGHVNIQWDASDDAMLYLNVGNGFKAGGFDEDNSLGRLDVAEFEDESVVSIEAGAKITIGGGRGRLNIAAFSSEYDDVQVSTFDGNAAFVVGNAAKSKVDGIEADVTYAISDGLTFNGAFSLLDATYDSFPDAACNIDQILAARAATGSRACVQDLSGQPLQFAPDATINLGLNYDAPISNALMLGLGVDYNWSDDVVIGNDLDTNLIQESYGKLNARIGISEVDGKWSIAIVGKNLTEEKTFSWGNDVPLGSFGFDNSYFKNIDPPRTFELHARYNF
jgi:outer membrane receptor protein involved in Fe transport